MSKAWEGRFNKKIDKKVDDFNSSISFDQRLYKEDIEGSIAHAKMLSKQNIISKDDMEKIIHSLNEILEDIENGKIEFSEEYEDIHMNIEKLLIDKIGDTGKRLHTARSRNDQVALDMKLWTRKSILDLKKELINLLNAIVKKANENLDTIMPGFTHLQHAQAITFSHYLMAYANMFKRDVIRLNNAYDLVDEMPLGAGALATTTHNIDRDFVREELNFKRLTDNSLDSVADRDYLIEFLNDISIIMMHLSRISEEFIIWSSTEYKYIELDDSFATGSSIMPQKKNPDVLELIRGKCGRVYGDLINLLTVFKGLPLAYNKDMQEDKEAIFDAYDTVMMCLKTFIPLFETTTILKEHMLNSAKKGFLNATDCADYLVKKGMPFRAAYKVIGEIVSFSIKNNKDLTTLTLEEYKNFSDLFSNDIYEAIDLNTCVNNRKVLGGPEKMEVKRQINVIISFIKENQT